MVTYRRDRVYQGLIIALLAVIGLICFFPMFYVVIVSITPYNEYLRQGGVVLFPREVTLEAYQLFWQEPYVLQCFLNTIFISTVGTAMNMLFTVLMAYPLSKKDLVGRKLWTSFCLIPMLITGGMVPTYLVVKDTHLIDTLWSLIIPSLISPYTLLITRTFFAGIDQSLHESARIDGAREFRILLSIVLPVSLPIMATIGLMYGVNHWNTYFSSIIYISSSSRRTLQVVLREMLNRANKMEADVAVPTRSLQMAGVVISAIPIIAVYPFLQKYFTQGLMLGSIKG